MQFKDFYFSEQLLAYFPATTVEKLYLPEPLVDCYVDPSQSELNKLYAEAELHGVRFAMDELGRVIVWNENIFHHNIQKKLNTYDGDRKMVKGTKLVLKMIYTKGDNKIELSEDQPIKTEAQLLSILPKEKLRRLKIFFPLAVSINTHDTHKKVFRLQ